ncbi:DUF3833 family protein [Celeribacter sp.]|uniref:DUF3833 family protein n=1 Tax=Celeribacter sp. TaxID=1890673 RepID=UPI003A95B748
MKLITALLALALIAVVMKTMVFSFRAQRPDHYAQTGPTFDMTTHLAGPILSEGVIFGPRGRMNSRFVAQMKGEWNDAGTEGTLEENFTYNNGNTQTRKWFLTKTSPTTFTATASDIRGEATGKLSGATLEMRYAITLPEDAGGHTLNVTDWLYLTENGVILNKSEMRKYGINVAELVATMRPAAP